MFKFSLQYVGNILLLNVCDSTRCINLINIEKVNYDKLKK